MSRHTVLAEGQHVSRSLGNLESQDFVVVIRGDRKLEIKLEPNGRRLGRGEKVETLELDLEELWDNRAKPKEIPADSFVDDLLKKLPVASLSGTPEKVGYVVKVWLLGELKKLREKGKETK